MGRTKATPAPHHCLQVNLFLLAPLRIIMAAAVASCYTTVGGFSYPWLQAIATQLCSFCISVGIDIRYRSLYQKRRAEEAARFAASAERRAATKLEGLLSGEAAPLGCSQVGRPQLACGLTRGVRSACHRLGAAFRPARARPHSSSLFSSVSCSTMHTLLLQVSQQSTSSPKWQPLCQQRPPAAAAAAAVQHAPALPFYPDTRLTAEVEDKASQLAREAEECVTACSRCGKGRATGGPYFVLCSSCPVGQTANVPGSILPSPPFSRVDSCSTHSATCHLTPRPHHTPRFDAALTSEAGHPAAKSAGVVQQQVDDIKQRLQQKGNRQIYKSRLCRLKVKVLSLSSALLSLPSALLCMGPTFQAVSCYS